MRQFRREFNKDLPPGTRQWTSTRFFQIEP